MSKNRSLPFNLPFTGLFRHIQTFNESLHTVSAILLHTLRNMPVYVQRERCCSVPHVLLYGLNIVTVLQGDHGIRMAHVMESDVRQSDALYNALEIAVHSHGAQISANLIGEHQPPRVAPCAACTQSRFSLPLSLLPEDV